MADKFIIYYNNIKLHLIPGEIVIVLKLLKERIYYINATE